MDEFISYLKKISPINEDSSSAFLSKCKIFNLSKGDFLVKSGQVSQYLYFVKSGIGKVYYLKDDKEIIDWISDEGNLLTSVTSFLTHQPSKHIVQLMEDSELIGISYSDLESLFSKYHGSHKSTPQRMLNTIIFK